MTLNYGLRYEYFTVMRDANNLIGNWDPTVGFEQVGVNINSAYNGYHKDFSPRLGIAWDIGGKGKTVVRAGGGVYYVDLVAAALVDQTQIPGKSSGLTCDSHGLQHGCRWDGSAAQPITSGGIGTASTLGFRGVRSQLVIWPAHLSCRSHSAHRRGLVAAMASVGSVTHPHLQHHSPSTGTSFRPGWRLGPSAFSAP